jgi:hypothetical protein
MPFDQQADQKQPVLYIRHKCGKTLFWLHFEDPDTEAGKENRINENIYSGHILLLYS